MAAGAERREAVIEYLAANERAKVDALAAQFDVSQVTMRNDLKRLEQTGYVARLHGSATLSQTTAAEIAFAERRGAHAAAKQAIGREAATLVNDGDAIILDGGTTTLEIARHLKDHESLLVMTNGLDIARLLSHAPGVELIALGGRIRKSAMCCSGPQTEASLANHRFDKLFLGLDALHLDRGVTTDHETEASLNRAMIEIVDQVVAVTDSSKMGRKCSYLVSQLDKLDRLVTDAGLPTDYAFALREQYALTLTTVD